MQPLPDATHCHYRPLLKGFFEFCVRRMMRRSFSTLTFLGELPSHDTLPKDLPWLFVANHFSWWDGFFLWELQKALAPHRRIYTVMLAREFMKSHWFRHIGAIPITPGSLASSKALLKKLDQLCSDTKKSPLLGSLKNHTNHNPIICSFFPQGSIEPSFKRPYHFESGLRSIVQTMAPVVAIPIAMHIEPLCLAKPRAFMSLGPARIILKASRDLPFQLAEDVTEASDKILNPLRQFGEKIESELLSMRIKNVNLFEFSQFGDYNHHSRYKLDNSTKA